jgi:hypothetical protein
VDIDGLDEIVFMIHVAKKLYDMGKYDLVAKSFCDELEYDNYYHGMYELIGNIFEYSICSYDENRVCEIHVLSDPAIVDFYILAGKYGKLNDTPDSKNPYIKKARQEAEKKLSVSHCMDWILMGHTEPTRKYHSRIGIIISHECACCDIGVVALRLFELHEWFKAQCEELRKEIAAFKPKPKQSRQNFRKERQAIAA